MDGSSSDESFEEHFILDNIINQEADDDLDGLLIAFIEGILADDNDIPAIRGGSVLGKSRNIDRNRSTFDALLNADYFDENPIYGLHLFRRRFRMNRSLYLQIERRLQETYRFFTQR